MEPLLFKIVMAIAMLGGGSDRSWRMAVMPFPAVGLVSATVATIDGPTVVTPGTPVIFTIKGVPSNHLDKFDWRVFNRPAGAMVLDLADRAGNPVLMFWSKTPGKCAVIADVNVPPDQFQLLIHEFVVGGPDPGPDPPPLPPPDPEPPPPPSDLSTFVAGLVDKLDIETGSGQVVKFFRDAIVGIDGGELRGSKAIVEAVSKRIVAMGSTKWHAFSTLLYQRLINELKLVTQIQWKEGYKQVILGLEKSQ